MAGWSRRLRLRAPEHGHDVSASDDERESRGGISSDAWQRGRGTGAGARATRRARACGHTADGLRPGADPPRRTWWADDRRDARLRLHVAHLVAQGVGPPARSLAVA